MLQVRTAVIANPTIWSGEAISSLISAVCGLSAPIRRNQSRIIFEVGGFPGNSSYHEISDTVQAKFTQTVLSIGYKFQPTFKVVFFSFGMDCSINLIKIEQQKNEQTNGGWDNELSGYGVYPQTNTSSSASSSFNFVNFP